MRERARERMSNGEGGMSERELDRDEAAERVEKDLRGGAQSDGKAE